MPPCQIVPALADEGKYIASESTFYRVLREEKMQNHRGRSQSPGKHGKPTSYCATLGYHLFIRTDKRHLLLPVPDRGYFQPRHRWLGSLGGGIRRACQRTDPPGMPWPETTDDSTACPAFRQWISNEGGDDAGNVIRFGHHAVQQQAACE